MRLYSLTLASLLLVGAGALGQQPAAAPAPALDPAKNRLDALLMRWEHEMRGVQTFAAQCTRTTIDKVFQSTDIFEGTATFKKPNMAMLKMFKKNKPDDFEMFVFTGNLLYEYSKPNKVVRIHELTPPKNGQNVDDNGFLSFLSGMQAIAAKKRYDMTLVQEDQWYYYVRILPKEAADKADFQEARLVLNKQSFLPRELWFKQPNENEVKWDIPRIDTNAALNIQEFVNPQIPQGWGVQRVPRSSAVNPRTQVPPRVVRPNQ